ncbi:MAG: tryptophan synthase subunit alpha [Marinilabiliales bacterium]|nr:MAG: tryptophan synthase subunit alpha [Marinilabiliales bacterium]
MNKLELLFNNKQSDILSIYFTGGYPKLDDTSNIITELEKSKVDLIEIGIPFSDPVADGPVIQYSNSTSIENGMNLALLLNQLSKIKRESKIPKILMGYFNPILQFGVENFCRACKKVGVDGVIIPDLPLIEYELKYQVIFKQYGIHFIFLVSPQTSELRLKEIDQLSTCFIYAVSTNSTTGGAVDFSTQKDYFLRLKKILKNPFLIGFGVKNKETFKTACNYANGAIIGSSFINAISKPGELNENIQQFIQNI